MDIQVLGAWGELIGGISGLVAALAVVGSLVFVGVQVRTNTATIRVTARQATLESVQRIGLCITENVEFADIVVRASRGDTIEPVERLRLNQFLRSYCQSQALYFYFEAQGLLTQQEHQGQLEVLRKTVSQSYFPAFWQRHGNEYEPEFASIVEDMIANAEVEQSA